MGKAFRIATSFFILSIVPQADAHAISGFRAADHSEFCIMAENGDLMAVKAYLDSVDATQLDFNAPCSKDTETGGRGWTNFPLELALAPTSLEVRREKGRELAAFLISKGASFNVRVGNSLTLFEKIWKDYRKNHKALGLVTLASVGGVNLKKQIDTPKAGEWRYKQASGIDDDITGMTPLMFFLGYSEVDTNLEYTSRKNRDNPEFNRAAEIIRQLVAVSDINAQDAYGRTALHHMVNNRNSHIAQLFLELGADRSIKDGAGLTALDYAFLMKNQTFIQLLQSTPIASVKTESKPAVTTISAQSALSILVEKIEGSLKSNAEFKNTESDEVNPISPSLPSTVETDGADRTASIAMNRPIRSISSASAVGLPAVDENVVDENVVDENIVGRPSQDQLPRLETLSEAKRELKNGNFKKARTMLSTLSSTNNPEATYQLGRLYAKGLGGSQDFAVAREKFIKAAGANHPEATFSLGLMYLKGDGVAKNEEIARKYLQKAKRLGDVRAASLLANLHN